MQQTDSKQTISRIIKRDGRVVDFDKSKITEAIWKAIKSVGGNDRALAERLSNRVVERLERQLKPGEIPHVEQVQDLVEKVLVENNLYNVAKAYILYRALHAQIREFVDSYLENKSWLVKENANTTYSLQALNFHISSQVISQYWLHRIFNKGRTEIREAHLNGDFHIHNLGILGAYCVGWDLKDLLTTGFKGVRGKVSAKPARHFRVALGHVVNFIFTLQGEAAGAQAFSNFDTYLAPFIRYDSLDYKSVKQALQEFMFNMNIPTRVGFQSLCGDEPIIVKEKGKIKVIEIGKLVDREFEKYPHKVIEQNPHSYALENHDDYQVLSFNPDGKAVWTRVKAFIRHRVPKNSEFVRIRTNRGEAKVSKAHSLFAFSKFNGKFNPVPKSAEDVKIADDYRHLNEENHFIALRSLDNQGEKEEIDLVEIIDELPGLQKNVFVKINPTHTLRKIKQRAILEEQSLIPFYKEFGLKDRGVWESWLESKSIRYDIWRKYGGLNMKAEFRLKNSDVWYPRFLKGKLLENFVKLCAWYISEGHTAISTPLYISRLPSGNAREIVKLLKALNALGQVARNKGYSRNGGKTKTVLKITGKGLLAEIVSKTCGYLSFNKVVPWFIFDLSPKYQRIFIETVLKGDGAEYQKYWDYSTTSGKLCAGLCLLLSQNKFRFAVYTEKTSRNNEKWRDGFVIRIFKENSIPKKTYSVNDFEARVCLGVEKFNYEREYEYDISVNLPQENFVGGAGLLVFHNTPFSNVTLDLKVPSFMEDEPVVVGGEILDATYGEFQEEMNIFNRALAEVMLEGDASARVFTFPIPTINITRDFNWDDEIVRKVLETSAKYGIPYFANFINSDMNPEDVRSMCCHLRLDKRELKKRGGGLFGANPLTGCYDENTEILTEKGWKLFKDLSMNDRVFTLNENNEIELHHPTRLFEYEYDGEMIHFKSRSLDLLVTPNHRMVVDTANGKRAFVEARDFIPNTHRIPKGGIWKGEEKEYFVLPPVPILQGSGPESKLSAEQLALIRKLRNEGKGIYQLAKDFDCNPVTILNVCNDGGYGNRERVRVISVAPPLKVKMDDWLKFFGFWLAEGSTDNEKIAKRHGYRVVISQVDRKKREEIENVLRRLPFHYREENFNLVIYNKQLWNYLRQFGNEFTKFIPEEIKRLDRKQLKILFDWMIKGDGHVRKATGQISYWTSSKKLADDLQEIALKLGYMATISTVKKKASEMNGRRLVSNAVYVIGIQKLRHYRLREQNIRRVRYRGKVYCCEVENHTVFVRRNGKVSWCGNSIGVTTINMPRIGFLSKSEGDFFARLDRMMVLAKDVLEIKRKWLEKFTEAGLYPYSRFYLRHVKEAFGSYWKNHFSTIGLIGMNEACLNFLGYTIGDPEGLSFSIKVLDFMRKRLQDFQEETGNIFNLEATPAEGTSHRLARLDKKTYPSIIVANEEEVKRGAAPYYTNSTHLPVYYTDDLWEYLRLQDPLQTRYTGGTVAHIWLGESNPPVESVAALVRKVCENFRLPYFTLTPTFSICPEDGYLSGEQPTCPKCGRTTEVYSRVVGYLRPIDQWNLGKQEEFKQRKTFDKALSRKLVV